jgi:nucleotide-binding universal stress UspA family protein
MHCEEPRHKAEFARHNPAAAGPMTPGVKEQLCAGGGEMKVVLVPVDGSACSLRAVHYLINAHAEGLRPQIHLVNVQSAMTGDVRQFVASDDIKDYQHEQSDDSLSPARGLLDGAGISYQVHEEVGQVVERIVRLADNLHCDHIVMGTHGRTALADLLVGSTTIKVVHQTKLPVVVVK